MMDNDILGSLEDIGRMSVARLSPAVNLAGDTALARRNAVLRTIRGTVLPRRLEFTAANGDCLAIEVNSSRVTDVFRVRSGPVPDFETESREALTDKMAQLVTDIANAPAPLELNSLKPDTLLEADDVGITLSEIEKACAGIVLTEDPIVAVVPDTEEPAPQAVSDDSTALADAFFEGAGRFATGRVLVSGSPETPPRVDGACASSGALHPDQELLTRFAADLAGWDSDAGAKLDHPQLIVMRPSGGKGSGLAVLNDGHQIAIAAHETRKLGAVVSLWTALLEGVE